LWERLDVVFSISVNLATAIISVKFGSVNVGAGWVVPSQFANIGVGNEDVRTRGMFVADVTSIMALIWLPTTDG
jgi:hypothetical protein